MTAIGTKLLTLRQAAGLTQGEAARSAGVDQSILCRIESGERKPTLPVLGKLATAYKADLAELAAILAHEVAA